MRQFCRDNVTMFSGHKVVWNCHFTIFVVATPSRHWGLTIFRLFSGPWLFPEAVLHCRVVVVAKLENCRMPALTIIHSFLRTLIYRKMSWDFQHLFWFKKKNLDFFVAENSFVKLFDFKQIFAKIVST